MSTALHPDARCLGCDYRLRDLPSTVCPECGRAFDPADASTYRAGVRSASWRRLARPPGLVELALTWTMAAVLFLGSSEPGGALGAFFPLGTCAGLLVPPCLCGAYLIRAVATSLDRTRADDDRDEAKRPSIVSWATLPVTAAVVVVAVATSWPLAIRFELSRDAFELEARRLMATPLNRGPISHSRTDRYLGLYRVRSCRMLDKNQDGRPDWIEFSTGGFIENFGFVYDPDGLRKYTRRGALPSPWGVYLSD